MQNIHIVTVATKPGGHLKWLEESCIRNGTKLIILGMGSEWKGYITKYILMNEFLKNIPDDDIVCFVDAYDVLMIQHIDKLKEKFLKAIENTDYKMICALDSNPYLELQNWYYESNSNIIINSGTYIGYSKNIQHIINWMINESNNDNTKTDDQLLLNKYYKLFENDIYIDKLNKFFLAETTLIHERQQTDDFIFLHRFSNVDMISALILYNYNISIAEIIALKKTEIPYFVNKVIDHIKTAVDKLLKI
jgi:hypothetical protein